MTSPSDDSVPKATPGGFFRRALSIDVSSGTSDWLPLDTAVLRAVVGGVGLGTHLLLQHSPPGVDPLAPEAPLVVAFSPLVGTPLTTSAKFAVVAKSPLTGRISDALASSHFAIAGRQAGMDALVVSGRADELSTILIEDGRVRVEPTPSLAGASASEVGTRLRERLGGGWRVLATGVAGERGVRYATLSSEGRHAGRGGLGAVLGAKEIKAIAVRGKARVAVHDPRGVVQLSRDLSRRSLGRATEKYREMGTVANLLVFNRLSVLPTHNFREGSFAGAASLSAEELQPLREEARVSCAACTIGCEHLYTYRDSRGGAAGGARRVTRVEYESLFALGSLVGIDDPDAVLEACARCDDLGIDTISAGGTIAFAMEAHERGLLPEGIRFGDKGAFLELLDDIAHRRGLGDRLAEGSRHLAETLGGDASSFACHVKGLELPGYEPRALQTMALGLAVGTRGADHNRSGAYEADFAGDVDRFGGPPQAHAALAAAAEDRAAVLDSLILCKFLRGVFDDVYAECAEMLSLVTGWDVDAAELREVGRRVVDLRKLFNEREGWTRAEDTLPPRVLEEPLAVADGREARLDAVRLRAMIDAYYAERGWQIDDGVIPASRRAELEQLGVRAGGSRER